MESLIEHGPDLDAVMLLVCDQPLVETELIKQLIARYGETGKIIIASSIRERSACRHFSTVPILRNF
jgi:CTP:molybdopterin cytidylyltransferase MocA